MSDATKDSDSSVQLALIKAYQKMIARSKSEGSITIHGQSGYVVKVHEILAVERSGLLSSVIKAQDYNGHHHCDLPSRILEALVQFIENGFYRYYAPDPHHSDAAKDTYKVDAACLHADMHDLMQQWEIETGPDAALSRFGHTVNSFSHNSSNDRARHPSINFRNAINSGELMAVVQHVYQLSQPQNANLCNVIKDIFYDHKDGFAYDADAKRALLRCEPFAKDYYLALVASTRHVIPIIAALRPASDKQPGLLAAEYLLEEARTTKLELRVAKTDVEHGSIMNVTSASAQGPIRVAKDFLHYYQVEGRTINPLCAELGAVFVRRLKELDTTAQYMGVVEEVYGLPDEGSSYLREALVHTCIEAFQSFAEAEVLEHQAFARDVRAQVSNMTG